MTDLVGRTVCVMGAGGGLGPVAAEAAVKAGARVVLVEREKSIADAVAHDLSEAGFGTQVLATRGLDLLDEVATKAFAAEFADDIDIVWHLVGGWRGGTTLADAPTNHYDTLEKLLVRTTWNVVRAFAPILAKSNHGRFAIVSSPQSQTPTSTNAAYAATKAAAEALTLALASELAPSGATANIVRVKALLTRAMFEKDPSKLRPGFVPVDEVADALVWLSGSAAAMMNGHRLSLTGPVEQPGSPSQ
jgi:NAD(P)-dependent dehydrogenase (short-subunit alcohol dehydrogenase family)